MKRQWLFSLLLLFPWTETHAVHVIAGRALAEQSIERITRRGIPVNLVISEHLVSTTRIGWICDGREAIVWVGIPGSRVEENVGRLERYLLEGRGLIKAVHIQNGQNDSYWGAIDLAHLKSVYARMAMLIANAGARSVFYALTPVDFGNPRQIRQKDPMQYAAIQAIIRAVGNEQAVGWIDTPATLPLAPDGAHLTKAGVRAMKRLHRTEFYEHCENGRL